MNVGTTLNHRFQYLLRKKDGNMQKKNWLTKSADSAQLVAKQREH